MAYCFDTSGFCDAYLRRYPPETFPGVWEQLSELARGSRIVSPKEVYYEIAKQSDWLKEWAKGHKNIFLDVDMPQQQELRKIMKQFPTLVDVRKGRSGADPWVVSLARVLGYALVTDERERRDINGRPKIPDVCKALGIKYCNITEMFTELKIKFE